MKAMWQFLVYVIHTKFYENTLGETKYAGGLDLPIMYSRSERNAEYWKLRAIA